MPPINKIEFERFNESPVFTAKAFEGKRATANPNGVRLVADRLRKLGELAPNNQPIQFSRLLIFKEGDKVPSGFRGVSGVKVSGRGTAVAAYTDGWCQSHWNQSGDWKDCWGECWDNSTAAITKGGLVVNSLTTGIKAFALEEFSPKEIQALAKYNIGR